MKISKRIAYQLIFVTGGILAALLLIIYFLFTSYRRDEFRERISIHVKNIAQLYAETDSLDPAILVTMDQKIQSRIPDEKLLVFDKDRNLIIQKMAEDVDRSLMPGFSKLSKEHAVYFELGSLQGFGYHYNGKKKEVYVYCLGMDQNGLQESRQLRLILFSVFIAGITLVYIFGRRFASQLLSPLENLVHQLNEIDISVSGLHLREGFGSDEISLLTQTFNNMLLRLENSINTQKSFISNASHELRTPLTVISVQLDVALMQERDSEEYKKTIESVREEVKSLNELANKLLVLTNLEDAAQEDRFESIRIDEILWNSRNDVMKRNGLYKIHIHFSEGIESEHHLNIIGNATLLRTAFNNIADNACKYSDNHRNDIYISTEGNNCIIQFTDSGIGIPESDLRNIFQPFYRSENVKSLKGHGIGLSLVEKIIELHQGRIEIVSKLGKGTSLKVFLPLQ